LNPAGVTKKKRLFFQTNKRFFIVCLSLY